MLEVNGKREKCSYAKIVNVVIVKIYRTTNARCPQCKKKLELRGEGAGQIFACKCGYREKLSTFQERRKKNLETKLISATFKNI